jgi:trimeric autotransporter adhesin
MRVKRMINFTAGLLFVGIFCLNSGAFGYLHSGNACLSSGKGAEQARLSSEVVFIDPAVPDAATIEVHLPEGAEVVRLSPAMDGVAQISAHLAKKGNLSTIRIISHGNGGHFVLNGKRIDRDFLRDHGNRITPWGRALADKGDILLYACNLAETDEGRAFVENFVALTGADVAASTDRTGGHQSSGIGHQTSNHGLLITDNSSLITDPNWALEFQTGNIETAAIAVYEYQHHLATYAVTSDADSGANTLRQAIIDANTSGEDDTINIQDSIATITIASQLPEIVATGGALTINGGDGVIVKVTTPGASSYRVFEIDASDKTINISDHCCPVNFPERLVSI